MGYTAWITRRTPAAALLVAMVVLTGCETMVVSALNGAASEIANRDCSLERLFTREPVCLDPPEPVPLPVAPTVFCFRNIAGVSCYTEPGEMEDAIRHDAEQRMPLGS